MKLNEVIEKLDITLNEMQEATSKAILHSNKDVIVLSPTGSGKTYAYLLPLIELLDPTKDEVQAVVLVPGRELAKQSANVVQNIKSGLRVMALYGGRPTMDEHREMRNVKPQIVFATPGRLNDHLDKENFESKTIQWLIIDEFDKCLEMGFQQEMQEVVDKLPMVRRRILLSATEADSIPKFINIGSNICIDYRNNEDETSNRVQLNTVYSTKRDKLETLSDLLKYLGDKSSIVFLNYRESVIRTAIYLQEEGFSVSIFHGGLEQKEREAMLYQFSNGSTNILVSTNLGARGLDIPDVDNIIHYHFPENEDEYIHRVGRTARWDKCGNIYFLLGPDEQLPNYINQKVDVMELPDVLPTIKPARMSTLYIGKGKKDKISKGDIVGFLCKKAGVERMDIGKIDVMPRFSYVAVSRTKISQILKMTKGEKIKGISTVVEEVK
ncbi:DEAD/DEAH box helicase [Prevotella pallens]|jgi:dbpA RNA binding domain protein|uniref:DEAD/DEAH box helicase n=1 Tax=Prevotella pallens TaxID=60133 RepID=UPI001CB5DAA8|nr:DEAD/DEAH box helicase [Prevotella pallens]MBF1472197.1 DEAD/DEAH box helicase [Prevotella pallens]MBF1476918.1 DEAD/DEAH box helicase [Prevotella pallens]MBF1516547.1 DEAD/DEAH box helicase [Prevotella pallens]